MRKLKNEELNRPSVAEFRAGEKIPLVVLLDNVRSLNNIGSVFRTCDAFAVEALYLCGITATPPHRDIHKTALGATESVVWKHFKNITDAVQELQSKDYTVFAIEQAENSIKLDEVELPKDRKYAVILGNEVTGVGEETMLQVDAAIEVPQFGTKHSLNIAVCAGIVVWEFFTRLR